MEDVVHDAGGEAILLNHGTGLPQAKTPHLADLEACLHRCSIQYGQHWKEVRSRPELTLLMEVDLKGVKPMGTWTDNTAKQESQARSKVSV